MMTRNNFIVQEQNETEPPQDLTPESYNHKGALIF